MYEYIDAIEYIIIVFILILSISPYFAPNYMFFLTHVFDIEKEIKYQMKIIYLRHE